MNETHFCSCKAERFQQFPHSGLSPPSRKLCSLAFCNRLAGWGGAKPVIYTLLCLWNLGLQFKEWLRQLYPICFLFIVIQLIRINKFCLSKALTLPRFLEIPSTALVGKYDFHWKYYPLSSHPTPPFI